MIHHQHSELLSPKLEENIVELIKLTGINCARPRMRWAVKAVLADVKATGPEVSPLTECATSWAFGEKLPYGRLLRLAAAVERFLSYEDLAPDPKPSTNGLGQDPGYHEPQWGNMWDSNRKYDPPKTDDVPFSSHKCDNTIREVIVFPDFDEVDRVDREPECTGLNVLESNVAAVIRLSGINCGSSRMKWAISAVLARVMVGNPFYRSPLTPCKVAWAEVEHRKMPHYVLLRLAAAVENLLVREVWAPDPVRDTQWLGDDPGHRETSPKKTPYDEPYTPLGIPISTESYVRVPKSVTEEAGGLAHPNDGYGP